MGEQPVPIRETTITLELAADDMTWQQFHERIARLQSVAGIQQTSIQRHSNAMLFPTRHWATVAVTIRGTQKAHLRRVYTTVTNHVLQSGLHLTGRRCVLTDLYD